VRIPGDFNEQALARIHEHESMSTQWPGAGGDFETLARQYWSAWGDAMRVAAKPGKPGPGSGVPNWQDAIDWWSKLAQGGNPNADATLERFNAQARDWYGQMQQVAAQFAGQHAKPADVVGEWKRALGALGENPFPDMFRAMRGHGAQGIEQWAEAAAPYLEAWRREQNTWLGMPAFGIGREHQERLQKLGKVQLDYQQAENAYNALMMKAAQGAYDIFESKLAEREEPGRQLTSARALFDLWIDAAEEAYAKIALSPDFRKAYGARVNALMRLRQAVQGEVEQMSAMFGMPTRSDLDTAFRKISELERSLRTLRDELTARPATAAPSAARQSANANAPRPRAPARKAAATKRDTSAKTSKKAPAKGKSR
jgi:class III poly(R)-hydroxyalkanoic acid synthase PhaE subunit